MTLKREWLIKYKALKAYKEKHGNCCVPQRVDDPSLKSLSKWVRRQREYYKALQEDRKSPVTNEQIDLLNEIGFTWNASRHTPVQWIQRYNELLDYKAEHGHVRVPQDYPILGEWVANQRRQYKLFKDGRRSSLTPERIDLLKQANFIWNPKRLM